MGEYFGFDIIFNPDGEDVENWFTHSIKSTFKEVLLDVYHTIDNYTNPQSEDNKVAFESALTNVKDNTFIGSAYEVVDTVPNDIKKRLPEIIHGSGVTFVGGVEFHENQLNDMINDSMANDYYEHLKANGGYDDIDDF